MNSYSPDLEVFEHVFEGLRSKTVQLLLQNQKMELAVSEDKIEEEISQTLEYTNEPEEENKAASSKSAMKKEAIHVKLPKIKLKSFSGNPVEWPSFRDSF